MAMTCFHNGILLSGTNSFQNAAILVKDSKIIDVFNEARFEMKNLDADTTIIDVEGAYISPGFIDTHIHGCGGHGTDTLFDDPRSLVKMAHALPQYGITSFFPTLYPNPAETMCQILKIAVDNIEAQEKESCNDGARIAGIHMEGPFISPKRLGVHKRECAIAPDCTVMQKFIDLGKGYIRNMTVAPELKGMHEIAVMGANNNIVMQCGHTDAEYEHVLEGMQVGIHHSTHFFNAMSPMHHRNPSTVGTILLEEEISCEIIPDGFHVHPMVLSLLFKNKSHDNIVLVTDSISPSGLEGSEEFYANGDPVYLKDKLFHRKSDDIIAGSSLSIQQGIRNLRSWGVLLGHCIRMATRNPASILHLPNKGVLCPNYDADIVVFDKKIDILYTMVEGKIVYQRKA